MRTKTIRKWMIFFYFSAFILVSLAAYFASEHQTKAVGWLLGVAIVCAFIGLLFMDCYQGRILDNQRDDPPRS
jgi:hypothetical protein